jgi:hypothetical protein
MTDQTSTRAEIRALHAEFANKAQNSTAALYLPHSGSG